MDGTAGSELVHIDAWAWSGPRDGEHFRRCSHCGGVHPDDLAAEPAWKAEWADRKYGWPHKFYVDIPNREPGRLYAVSASTSPPPATNSYGCEWVARDNLTEHQRYAYIGFGTRAAHHGKFYTRHLADPAIGDPAKETIQRVSGLRFEFHADRVRWELTETEGRE